MATTQLKAAGRFEETQMNSGSMTSPRLGVVRETMLMDPLLIKAPLGRTRSRGLTIPSPDFTFGTSSLIRDGGVAEVLSSWRVQSRQEDRTRRPDFLSLNRDAVRSGLVTSKELSQYRAQRGEVKALNQTTEQHEGRTSRRRPVVPDITFGVRNRPSSPLADLLSHQYGHRWMDQQLNRNQTSNHKHMFQTKLDRAAETRTSLLRKSRSQPVKQTPFKLPQFSQIPPALDTFRDPGARQRALRDQERTSGSGDKESGLIRGQNRTSSYER